MENVEVARVEEEIETPKRMPPTKPTMDLTDAVHILLCGPFFDSYRKCGM